MFLKETRKIMSAIWKIIINNQKCYILYALKLEPSTEYIDINAYPSSAPRQTTISITKPIISTLWCALAVLLSLVLCVCFGESRIFIYRAGAHKMWLANLKGTICKKRTYTYTFIIDLNIEELLWNLQILGYKTLRKATKTYIDKVVVGRIRRLIIFIFGNLDQFFF